MTDDEELIEQVARAVHEHLCRRDVMQYLDNDEDCAGIARAILPIIKAERIRGGEMVKEAAADAVWDAAPYVFNYRLTKAIRALSVPAIVEAGDGDL